MATAPYLITLYGAGVAPIVFTLLTALANSFLSDALRLNMTLTWLYYPKIIRGEPFHLSDVPISSHEGRYVKQLVYLGLISVGVAFFWARTVGVYSSTTSLAYRPTIICTYMLIFILWEFGSFVNDMSYASRLYHDDFANTMKTQLSPPVSLGRPRDRCIRFCFNRKNMGWLDNAYVGWTYLCLFTWIVISAAGPYMYTFSATNNTAPVNDPLIEAFMFVNYSLLFLWFMVDIVTKFNSINPRTTIWEGLEDKRKVQPYEIPELDKQKKEIKRTKLIGKLAHLDGVNIPLLGSSGKYAANSQITQTLLSAQKSMLNNKSSFDPHNFRMLHFNDKNYLANVDTTRQPLLSFPEGQLQTKIGALTRLPLERRFEDVYPVDEGQRELNIYEEHLKMAYETTPNVPFFTKILFNYPLILHFHHRVNAYGVGDGVWMNFPQWGAWCLLLTELMTWVYFYREGAWGFMAWVILSGPVIIKTFLGHEGQFLQLWADHHYVGLGCLVFVYFVLPANNYIMNINVLLNASTWQGSALIGAQNYETLLFTFLDFASIMVFMLMHLGSLCCMTRANKAAKST